MYQDRMNDQPMARMATGSGMAASGRRRAPAQEPAQHKDGKPFQKEGDANDQGAAGEGSHRGASGFDAPLSGTFRSDSGPPVSRFPVS